MMSDEAPIQTPMRISEKIKVFTQTLFKIEWIIVIGIIGLIGFIILIIFKMGKTPGEFSEEVVSKLLDHLSILEGALISIATQIVSALVSKIRSDRE